MKKEDFITLFADAASLGPVLITNNRVALYNVYDSDEIECVYHDGSGEDIVRALEELLEDA